MEDQSLKQKMISFATNPDSVASIEFIKKCRTQITSIITDDQFTTLVNALTLEIEANLIQRVVIAMDQIRNGDNSILDEK